MDEKNLTAAQTQGGGQGAAGTAAGAMDSGDWRAEIPTPSRQSITNKIMETLTRHLPISNEEGLQELMKTAVMFEEKIYNVATSHEEYLRKIALMMVKMEMPYKNSVTSSLHPNTASSGQNAHDPDLTRSQIEMLENILTAAQQTQGGGEGAAGAAAGSMDSGDWRAELLIDFRQRIVNKITEILKRRTRVHGQDSVQELMKVAVRLEENMYNDATSLDDYMRKISLKMTVMEIPYTKFMTYPLHPILRVVVRMPTVQMTMEAAAEDMSKEDVVEEVVVKKEQNYVVGHKENVTVGENEES